MPEDGPFCGQPVMRQKCPKSAFQCSMGRIRALGWLCGREHFEAHSWTRYWMRASSCWRANQEKRTAARAVRSDHECLLDVGGLGRPGDENAETGALERDAIIRLLHVMNNLASRHDQHKVLGHHEDRPMRTEGASGHPHGTVFRNAELARNDGDIESLKLVRILQGREINIGTTYFWD